MEPSDSRAVPSPAHQRRKMAMTEYTSKLLGIILVIYEMEGLEGVEKYAEANHIPIGVCRKLLNEYLTAQVETQKNPTLGWSAA